MTAIDLDAVRTKIRSLDFEPGTPEEIAEWGAANDDSRQNLVISELAPTPEEDALFALMLDEGVPPPLQTELVKWTLGHPDAKI